MIRRLRQWRRRRQVARLNLEQRLRALGFHNGWWRG